MYYINIAVYATLRMFTTTTNHHLYEDWCPDSVTHSDVSDSSEDSS